MAITMATIEDFGKLDIRVGTVVTAEDFEQARTPSFKLRIDFGPGIGVKTSSAQLQTHYRKEDLVGKRVLGVVNLPPRQIGPFVSEVLTLGVPDENGECVLVVPDRAEAVVGGKLY